jgi:hypothetical protein
MRGVIDSYPSGIGGRTIMGVAYRTSASCPSIDSARVVAALRGRLGMVAARDGAALDWSTLTITGPVEVIGAHGQVWYEWAATVEHINEPARYC